VDDEDAAVLAVIASPSRQRILRLLAQGVDHPEELAKRLKLRRQGVDKQLMELYKWGLVDRSAILPADGRPKIVYRLSERGQDFLTRAEVLVKDYRDGVRADFQRALNFLEDKLASGEIEEVLYLKKRKELETRYAQFLREPSGK
jgi:predicted ArsR family transcriptional regulator